VAREHREFVSTTVAAPIAAVWALVRRMDRYDEWIESTTELLRTDGEARLGAGFEERSRISGLWMATIRWTVTVCEPGRRLVFGGSGVAVLTGFGFAIDVEPLGEATEVTLTLWYTPRFGPLGTFLDVVTRSNVTNDQKRSIRTLAFLAEHPDDDARRPLEP
jgi:carbon monoxide dehydrogenase subunit G